MKLMLLNAPSELVRSMSDLDLDLIVVDSPRVIEQLSPLVRNCKLVPFRTRAKVDPQAIGQLRHLIREHKPQIAHSFYPKSLANLVLASLGLASPPRIVSFRGITSVPSRWDPANYLTFLSPRIALHACESNAVRAGLVRGGIDDSRCETVYNCVRSESFDKPGKAILAQFNIPLDSFVVGTIATIRPVKGIDLLLRAAIECADLNNVYWLIIGPVRDSRVARLAKDKRLTTRLRMTGMQPKAAGLASAFDLFVMPSRQEGLCRALLESMAQGACPVVSDAGGMKEVVRHGIDGLVVPKENVEELVKAIRLLAANPAMVVRLAASAKQRVAEMCSPELMRDRTLRLYSRIAA